MKGKGAGGGVRLPRERLRLRAARVDGMKRQRRKNVINFMVSVKLAGIVWATLATLDLGSDR